MCVVDGRAAVACEGDNLSEMIANSKTLMACSGVVPLRLWAGDGVQTSRLWWSENHE